MLIVSYKTQPDFVMKITQINTMEERQKYPFKIYSEMSL